jgi:hypothetical protein
MTSSRSHLGAAAIAGTLGLAAPGHAGPTILRDDQVTDLATTPALGRGYSLATNTYQSMCLSDITKTKPSYNFYYRFEELEADGSKKSTTRTSGSGSFDGGGMGVKVKVNASKSGTVIDGTTFYDHYIMVTADIDVYYSSIDESRSRIGEAARELLTSNDIPGFFDACGLYYARSIGRSAHFVSLFDYKSTTQSRDKSFEAKLETEIKGWGQSASASVQTSGDFKSEASSKRLTIESTAFGLGKNESASLVAYDLETFRKAVKDAFISMQNDDTGMVTTVEVVPWVENSDFQRILKLQEVKTGDQGATISPYAQKRILNQNGEFMAELDRAARAKLNVYYKAKQCRRRIDLDFKQDGKLLPEYASANILNHRSNARLPLATLDQQLNDKAINDLFDEHSKFLYGDTSGKGGVVQCIRDLTAAGLTTRPYREIASCAAVEPLLGVITGQVIDEDCMPSIAE